MFRYLDKRHYEPYSHQILSQLSKDNNSFLHRMALLQSLDVHRGCVNSVVWDDAGELLLSGSDDQQLILSKPWLGNSPTKLHTAHRANIFSAKFIPFSANRQIVSCSGDGMLIYTDLDRISETYNCKFTCHIGTCYDVITVLSDPYSFFSCGEDGTVRWFDLRIKTSCSQHECKEDILLNMGRAVTAIAINPIVHYQLAVSTQDSTTHIYDRRMLGTKVHDSYLTESNKAVLMKLKPESLEGKNHRVTSLRYSAKGDMVLASYSSDYLYLFDIQKSKNVPLGSTFEDRSSHDDDSSSGPTLKRLRLRGDWSDTGPQAVPESELRNQAEDVGQARPTLHSTLMQRMTDILSRMLPSPSSRPLRQRGVGSRHHASGDRISTSEDEQHSDGNNMVSPSDIACEGASRASIPISNMEGNSGQETSFTPPTITSPATNNLILSSSLVDNIHAVPQCSTLTEPFNIGDPPSVLNISSTSAPTASTSIPLSDDMLENVRPDNEQASLPSSIEAVMSFESSMQARCLEASVILGSNSTNVSADNVSEVIDSLSNVNDNRTTVDISKANEIASDKLQMNLSSRDHLSDNILNNDVEFASGSLLNTVAGDSLSDLINQNPISSSCDTSDAILGNLASAPETSPHVMYLISDIHSDIRTLTPHSSSSTVTAAVSNEPPEMDVNTEEVCDTSPSSDQLVVVESVGLTEELSASLPLDMAGPSTSLQISLPLESQTVQDRKSPKRTVPTQDEDPEDDTSVRRTTTNSRLARAIERVRQQMRDENRPSRREENISRSDGDGYDKKISYGFEVMQYKGHRNARTMIKEACFWGENHVMSGSDCGRVFVWDRNTGRLVMLWEADRHVVNCLQPHPTLPILATSGIDYDIKLWAPICDDPQYDEDNAVEITKRNEMLLAETRDTVTVPATFMIRMLASLNQLRRDRLRNRNQSDDEEEENDD